MTRLMSVADVAALFDVQPFTVSQWIARAERGELPPIPSPDAEIPTSRADGQIVRGWSPDKANDWREWRKHVPGRGWRKGQTGDVRYTTGRHIGQRPGRTHQPKDEVR